MVAAKLIPHLFSWFCIALVMLRGFPGRRTVVVISGMVGFAAGVAGTYVLLQVVTGDIPFMIIKDLVGMGFLLLWGLSVAAVYQSTGRNVSISPRQRFTNSSLYVGVCVILAGLMAGAVGACSLPGTGNPLLFLLFVLAAGALVFVALATENKLPSSFKVSQVGLAACVVVFLLFGSSSILRLDLFAPLSMKVMKFIHDFVHQFFESMLLPDHGFFTKSTWNFIGFLFGNAVGFWGALVIWFSPVLLVMLAISLEPLPSVAHIRQGAQRRRQMAGGIREKRLKLVVPVVCLFFLGGAVYQSRFPNVEYWDPKPVEISASPSGAIIIPKKGEIVLEDGKLHKYLFKQGGKEARFFVLKNPAGHLTVDLDACAICKPDGYGQSEGTVICYYCKTLIPLETVGKPGGCNPVPVPFRELDDSVHIDALTLINSWSGTVQSTARIKEGGK